MGHPFRCPPAARIVIRWQQCIMLSMIFLPTHLLLWSPWRLYTKSNATTATTNRMKTPRAPNERFARGKGATKTGVCSCVLVSTAAEGCRGAGLLLTEPVSRTRSSFQLMFACPTPFHQTPPERAQKNTNSIRLTTGKVSIRRIYSGSEIDLFDPSNPTA